MSYGIATIISFPCDSCSVLRSASQHAIKELDEKFKDQSKKDWKLHYETRWMESENDSSHARRMLEDLSEDPERYIQYGGYGGMVLWGGVCNHFDGGDNERYFKEIYRIFTTTSYLDTDEYHQRVERTVISREEPMVIQTNHQKSDQTGFRRFVWLPKENRWGQQEGWDKINDSGYFLPFGYGIF